MLEGETRQPNDARPCSDQLASQWMCVVIHVCCNEHYVHLYVSTYATLYIQYTRVWLSVC